MKTGKWLCLLASAASLLCSCEDRISMITVLNDDGSAHREICFKTDSATMAGKFREREHIAGVLDNEEWHKEWYRGLNPSADSLSGQAGDSVLMCRAARDFASVEEMAAEYPLKVGERRILKECRMDKAFRWFYTDYTFTETYEDFSDEFRVPLSMYFDNDALGFWLTGEPNVLEGYSGSEMARYVESMNEDFEKWVVANLAYDAVEALAENRDSLADCGSAFFRNVSREELLSQRDSLIDFVVKHARTFSDGDYDLTEAFAEYFNEPEFKKGGKLGDALDNDRKLQERFNRLYMELMTLNVDYRLAMPGAEIKDCGGGRVDDGVAVYRLDGMRLLSNGHAVTATFRSVNLWAWIVAGLVVLCAIGCYLFSFTAMHSISTSHPGRHTRA